MADNKLEAILRDLLSTIAAEQQYQDPQISVMEISSGGANYTTKIFLATISSKGKEDLKLFGKVALFGHVIRSQVSIHLYETEIMVYTHLANIFEGIQEKNAVPKEHRLVFPKLYGYNDTELEETIVLEDLTARGFSCYSRFEPIDWAYASKAVEEMAKLHALCIAFEKENSGEFWRLMQKFSFERTQNKDNLKPHWDGLLNTALKATTKENSRSLRKHYESMEGIDVFKQMTRTLRRPVLVHSDFRPSNLMHKIHDDGSVEIIPVDYQTLQAGCPVYDLQFFLMTGSDAAFRRQYQERLVEHYYKYLRDCLARLNLNPDEEYPRKDFDYEWKEKLPSALSTAIFSLPIVTVAEADAPVIDHNTGMNGFAVEKTSPLYAERINEVVEDFRRWGVLT